MKLSIFLDGIPFEIDSTEPDLLARWIIEILGRMTDITAGTLIELRVRPSFLFDAASNAWRPDWTADSRIIGQTTYIRSPRDLLDALAKQLDAAEETTDGG